MDFSKGVGRNEDKILSLADLTAEILNKNLEVYEYEGDPSKKDLRLIRRYRASSQPPLGGTARVLLQGVHFDLLGDRPYLS